VAVGIERKSLGLAERMGTAPKKETNDSPNKTYPFPARHARADYLERSRVEVRHTKHCARASDGIYLPRREILCSWFGHHHIIVGKMGQWSLRAIVSGTVSVLSLARE
jgi:hypothetical protein